MEFYLNPNRFYQHPGDAVPRLENGLKALRVPGFEWHRVANWIGVIHRFNFPYPIEALPDYLVPRYIALIQAVHPILMPVIDAFTQPLAPEDRAALIAGRRPARTINAVITADSAEFSRSIPPALRQRVLAAYQHRCARCQRTAEEADALLDIDHARPVCHGGTTRFEKLQPLCRPCHQWKGTRILRLPPFSQLRGS